MVVFFQITDNWNAARGMTKSPIERRNEYVFARKNCEIKDTNSLQEIKLSANGINRHEFIFSWEN
jgi:hypothetical protein